MVRDRNCDVLAVANIGDGCDLGFCEREQQAVKQQQRGRRFREAVDDGRGVDGVGLVGMEIGGGSKSNNNHGALFLGWLSDAVGYYLSPSFWGMAGDGIGWGGRSFGNVPGMTG